MGTALTLFLGALCVPREAPPFLKHTVGYAVTLFVSSPRRATESVQTEEGIKTVLPLQSDTCV